MTGVQTCALPISSVRTLSRQGSLVSVPGSYGLKRWLYARWGNRGNAVYTATGSLIAIGLSGFWAWLLEEPLLFPSLGATAFLFFETPLAEVGTPRNAVIGHFVAIAAAVGALAAFGLLRGIAPNNTMRVVLSLSLGFALLILDFILATAVGCSLRPFKMD